MAKAIFNITFNVTTPLSEAEADDWKKNIRSDLRLRGWEDFTVEYQEDEDANKQ